MGQWKWLCEPDITDFDSDACSTSDKFDNCRGGARGRGAGSDRGKFASRGAIHVFPNQGRKTAGVNLSRYA